MCLPNPGLRCTTHARMAIELAEDKTKIAHDQLIKTKKDVAKQHVESIDLIDSNHEVIKAEKKYQTELKKLIKARHEYSLTPENMDALKAKIIDIQVHVENPALKPSDATLTYNQETLDSLKKEYESLNREGKQRMLKYDRLHGTVNGVKPSKHGNAKAVIRLRNRQSEAFSQWSSAIIEFKSDEETHQLGVAVENTNNAYNHAMATFQHRRKGIIPPSRVK